MSIIERLTMELLAVVIEMLDTPSLLSLQQTCRALRFLCAERLWGGLELNFASDQRSPLVREERWARHFTGRKGDSEKQPWMVINGPDIELFLDAYKQGLLGPVLSAVRTINVVESVEGYVRNRLAIQECSGDNPKRFSLTQLLVLEPAHLPRLELIRVSSSLQESGPCMDLLSRFPRVEKYIWSTRSSGGWCPQYEIGAIMETTSLSLAIDQASPGNIETAGKALSSFSALIPQLKSLQLAGRDMERCVLNANQVRDLLQGAQRLRQLTLARVEVHNPERIEWVPSSVFRLQIIARADRRGEDVPRPPVVDCPGVKSLYVNLASGRDSANLQSLQFHNLVSLFYVAPKRDNDLHYDVSLFRSNPQLKRVVYSCSTLEGLEALGRSCGSSLEVLSLQQPKTRTGEILLYDIDAMAQLAAACTKLRFLEVRVCSRKMLNPLRTLKEFISRCDSLQEVVVVSTGRFNVKDFNYMDINSVNDGFCHHYLGPTRDIFVYRVDLQGFKQRWCKH